MDEKDLTSSDLPDEPTYWQLVHHRHKEEYDKLPPALRVVADQVDEVVEYYDTIDESLLVRSVIQEPKHHCSLPNVSLGQHQQHIRPVEHKCEGCGLEWIYHWTSRCWHIKKDYHA